MDQANNRGPNESELRDEPEEIERIGPEDAEAEEVMTELEASGYDVMDEGDFESSVTAESDQPEWINEEAQERSNIAHDPAATQTDSEE